MTSTVAPQPPEIQSKPPPRWTRAVAIPLAEFGKSLDDPDLGQWFEGFSARNSDMGEYEISNTGHLLIQGTYRQPRLRVRNRTGSRPDSLDLADTVALLLAPPAASSLPDGSHFVRMPLGYPRNAVTKLCCRRTAPSLDIIPDFVAEIKSPSNSRAELTAKINLFLEHGTKLAWYIDGETRTVIKFRPGQEPETLNDPEYVDGDDDVLPGFRFAVRERIFDLFADTE